MMSGIEKTMHVYFLHQIRVIAGEFKSLLQKPPLKREGDVMAIIRHATPAAMNEKSNQA